MKITKVEIEKVEKELSRLKGYVSVVLDDEFVVNDIRIIDGNNGLFVAMPSRKTTTGGYKDLCHPLKSEVRKMFEDAIFEEYNKENANE